MPTHPRDRGVYRLKVMEPKFIAQGLLKAWKEGKKLDTSTSNMCPLMYYLELNYQERHVKLCNRLGIIPLTLGEWLRKPIESVNSKP